MPTPTDLLDTAIHDLEKRTDANHAEVTKRLDAIVDKIGDMNDTIVDMKIEMTHRFAHLESRLDSYASISKWLITLIAPAIFTLIGLIVAGAWYAGKIDLRLTQIEQSKAVQK